MATWNQYELTDQGRKRLSYALGGKQEITISSFKVSANSYIGKDISALVDLENIKQTFSPSVEVINDNTVKIEAVMTNVGLAESYPTNTIGIYAGAEGNETLFAVATAQNADTMKPIGTGPVKNIITKFYITVDDTNSVTIKLDMDVYVRRGECIDISYPVHSVYMAMGGDDPATLFGGTWKKIEGRYIRASGNIDGKTYTAGEMGGELTHTISIKEMPRHSHTRGTMNITGSFWADDSQYKSWYGTLDGCFTQGRRIGKGDLDSSGGGYESGQIAFDASRTWTGHTSEEGGGQAMPITPSYIIFDVWVRTA